MHICGMKCILLFYFNKKCAFINPEISQKCYAVRTFLSELHICSLFPFEFTTILINHPAVFLFLAVNIVLSELSRFFKTVFQ